jgi:very-short-patch-repair endonuclease
MVRLGEVRRDPARSGEAWYGGVWQGMVLRDRHETDIEQIFREALERRGLRRGIDFATQYPLRHSFVLDFAFPEQKIAVEVDGRMWHSTPAARKRDGFKNHILKERGWRLYRFWDHEILDGVDECIELVLKAVQEGGR